MLTEAVATLHPFNTALGVHHPLFAGIEGVALTAHLNTNCWPGSAGLKHVPARAGNRGVVKIRVDFFFHLLVFGLFRFFRFALLGKTMG